MHSSLLLYFFVTFNGHFDLGICLHKVFEWPVGLFYETFQFYCSEQVFAAVVIPACSVIALHCGCLPISVSTV